MGKKIEKNAHYVSIEDAFFHARLFCFLAHCAAALLMSAGDDFEKRGLQSHEIFDVDP